MKQCIWWATITSHAQAVAEGHRGWLVLDERCDACGHKQIAVAPVGVPLSGLECSRCRAMACRAVVVPTKGAAGRG